jgi:glycosyltransferase involved in cell wall biosynthesis
MNLLFVHQNYAGQYREMLPRLARTGKHKIVFLTQRKITQAPPDHTIVVYKPDGATAKDAHPYTAWYESCIRNGIGAMLAARQLAQSGYKPDLIIGHAGWGELIFMKEVWPGVPVISGFEYYFIPEGGLIGFDPEFREQPDIAPKLRARNAPNYLSFMASDDGHTASLWQKNTYPPIFHTKIKVLHEGIRTDLLSPDHDGTEPLKLGEVEFQRGDEIVTYIARSMEPSRGIHIILRALPALQKARPKARIAMIGSDDISYGSRLPDGQTFRGLIMKQLGESVDWSRVHFVGQIPYPSLIRLLQLSRCHVYLTAPFVVSWSLLEAMALEKTVVASNVAPVRHYVEHGRTGFLVDFFAPDALAAQITDVLAHRENYREVGKAARRMVVGGYDFEKVSLPLWLRLLNGQLPKAKQVVL